ncbi:sulfate transporter-like isoform X1 [Branchiostoma floridae]|uniref:Sulfate transporter-like isoform X1 n=2 Tax=Branchiostoma floridae TaxID=7739 RepID=A0A9J7L7C2_BRAFL|nr:sulfate transporter-like isoform X1 [Branchiostoma floridae]
MPVNLDLPRITSKSGEVAWTRMAAAPSETTARLRALGLSSTTVYVPPDHAYIKYDQTQNDSGQTDSLQEKVVQSLKKSCTCSKAKAKKFLFTILPILAWLPKYRIRENIVGDVVSGITVGIMRIPQGMAYALLASVPPIFGLYSSFFPGLIYAILGTSKNLPFGTMAVVSVMVGSSVERLVPERTGLPAMSDNTTAFNATDDYLQQLWIEDKVAISATLTLMAGIFQLGMGICRLGFVTIYLSDPLVSGFTVGAAFHVVGSQVKYLLGLEIPRYSGPLSLVYTFIDVFRLITQTNVAALITSLICIIILLIGKEVNLRYKDKLRGIPIPTELIVLIIATLVSYYADLNGNYGVNIVGDIPTGLPVPKAPDVSRLLYVLPDAIVLSIVSFAVSLTLAKLFAKKYGYSIDDNQELIAYGASNLFSSFFSCFVGSTSISRTSVADAAGMKSQLMTFVSAVLLLMVLLFIGPLFRPLQQCVLASIVVVNLKSMFRLFTELKPLWKLSKVDCMVWVVTWLAVTLLGLDIGLGVGVGFSLLTVVLRTQRPNTTLLGQVPNCDIYRDLGNNQVKEIDGIKIFRLNMSLCFTNCDSFKTALYKKTGLDPVRVLARRKKEEKNRKKSEKNSAEMGNGVANPGMAHTEEDDTMGQNGGIASMNHNGVEVKRTADVTTIILDCGPINFVDSVGMNTLIQVYKDYKSIDVNFLLAHVNPDIRVQMQSCDYFEKVGGQKLFVSVHDAVLFAVNKDLPVTERPTQNVNYEMETHL